MSKSNLTLFVSCMLFWLAGCMDYICIAEQFPAKMLPAAITETHIFFVYCAVAAGANRITFSVEKYEYL